MTVDVTQSNIFYSNFTNNSLSWQVNSLPPYLLNLGGSGVYMYEMNNTPSNGIKCLQLTTANRSNTVFNAVFTS